MIKREKFKDKIWVQNMANEFVLLLISNLMYAVNTGQNCLITDVNGVKYTYPENVSFLKRFIGFNLYQIHKSTYINLNHISLSLKHCFSYKSVIMKDGIPLAVAGSVVKRVKRHYKKLKKKCLSWHELTGLKT